MSILPETIEQYFHFIEDPKTGDYSRFHLYCYCSDGSKELKFHREWKITGTEFALSSDPEELKQQRKIEETQRFRDQIYRQLERQGKYFDATKEGLVLQSSV